MGIALVGYGPLLLQVQEKIKTLLERLLLLLSSPDLAKEVNAFLHCYSQRSSLARECQQRLSSCAK